MAYIKQTWVNKETPLDAEHLNHIEEGISANSEASEQNAAAISSLSEEIANAVPETDQPNMQLVTDANGEKVWEEKAFYETTEMVVIAEGAIPQGSVTCSKEGYGDAYGILKISDIVVGDTYIITLNGVDYTGVAEWYEDTSSPDNNGVHIFDDSYNSTDPVYLTSYSGGVYWYSNDLDAGGKQHSLKITHVASAVKPLDTKFLPTTVPVIQSAQVGQTVVVKAVDADGKPTEWEAVDVGCVVCLDREISLTGDENGAYWSSDRIDMPIVPGVTYDVTYNGVTYSCVAKRARNYDMYIGNGALGGLEYGEDTGEPFVVFREGTFVALVASSGELAKIKVTSNDPAAMNFQTPILSIGYDDDGTAHLNYTFEEIVTLYYNGMPPVFHDGKKVYPLYEMDINNGDTSGDRIIFGFGIPSITVNKDNSVTGV